MLTFYLILKTICLDYLELKFNVFLLVYCVLVYLCVCECMETIFMCNTEVSLVPVKEIRGRTVSKGSH
jgi:hypothetical protein